MSHRESWKTYSLQQIKETNDFNSIEALIRESLIKVPVAVIPTCKNTIPFVSREKSILEKTPTRDTRSINHPKHDSQMSDFIKFRDLELERLKNLEAKINQKRNQENWHFINSVKGLVVDKRERQEIEMLNQNIASLEQQFKQKESRLLLTQDRLKRNIEALSNKNVLLQDEISLLEQDRISYVAERMLLTRKKQTHSISTQTITLVNNVSIQSEPLVDCQIPAKINIDEQANKTLTKIAQELNLGAVLDTIKHPAGKIEQCFENDISLFYYSNGTTKSLNKISNEYTLHFQNNDQKTFFADGSSEYLFYSAKIRSRTFKDGTVFNTFPDGQHETINVDGSRIQVFLDGTRVLFDGNGHEESFFPDGTHLVRNV